ncbi:glycoside hydrolase [Emericellopsis atlantica]|uniref:Glycoside hydrolase n=1 Tax=Emericellopsis atlantica TaxID=2614577 RepID=A0A9P7ZDS5_9HYPO|nr:glycoside hydrolase [Emericellopsis atlantica]KAG9250283.1 glycoside hydrolase [Emericellopsis atlantica]
MLSLRSVSALLASALYVSSANARGFYAHYMVGGIIEGTDHAARDIDDASALGFDAFALNIGAPNAGWATGAIKQLFDYADQTDFKLFFSVDFYQESNMDAYSKLLQDYVGRPSYLRAGDDNYPVVSSFSIGDHDAASFRKWKWESLGDQMYLLPNADNAPGYNNPGSWFQGDWGNTVDGVFGWETAWPWGGNQPENVSSGFDTEVLNAAHRRGKTYMAPLSPLQFKACCGSQNYRIGEVNLPQRMAQLLTLSPDFVEFITWNDAGESHYIGNIWSESQVDEDIKKYGNNEDWPHFGWQPLIASFGNAYKHGHGPDGMRPQSDDEVIGAMWYRTFLSSGSCNGKKPSNWKSAVDAVNWALVVDQGVTDLKVRVSSGGKVISETKLSPGLNYAAAPGIRQGTQKIEVVRGNKVVKVAKGAKKVTDGSEHCFYNFQVAGLE